MFHAGDSISNNHSQTNTILKGESILTSSPAGSKLISSIALATPLSSEQQKKRAAMLFGKLLSKNTWTAKLTFLFYLMSNTFEI